MLTCCLLAEAVHGVTKNPVSTAHPRRRKCFCPPTFNSPAASPSRLCLADQLKALSFSFVYVLKVFWWMRFISTTRSTECDVAALIVAHYVVTAQECGQTYHHATPHYICNVSFQQWLGSDDTRKWGLAGTRPFGSADASP